MQLLWERSQAQNKGKALAVKPGIPVDARFLQAAPALGSGAFQARARIQSSSTPSPSAPFWLHTRIWDPPACPAWLFPELIPQGGSSPRDHPKAQRCPLNSALKSLSPAHTGILLTPSQTIPSLSRKNPMEKRTQKSYWVKCTSHENLVFLLSSSLLNCSF